MSPLLHVRTIRLPCVSSALRNTCKRTKNVDLHTISISLCPPSGTNHGSKGLGAASYSATPWSKGTSASLVPWMMNTGAITCLIMFTFRNTSNLRNKKRILGLIVWWIDRCYKLSIQDTLGNATRTTHPISDFNIRKNMLTSFTPSLKCPTYPLKGVPGEKKNAFRRISVPGGQKKKTLEKGLSPGPPELLGFAKSSRWPG